VSALSSRAVRRSRGDGIAIAVSFSILGLAAACNRRRNDGEGTTAPAPPIQATAVPIPLPSPPIAGDAREALREVIGAPVKPGREIASIEPATNGDPQANAAGVLVAAVGGGKVVTVYAVDSEVRVGGPLDLGTARFVATDGPHVCAASRSALRCAWVDGSSPSAREAAGDTTGLWGGPGVLLRGIGGGTSWSLAASQDGFLSVRDVQAPQRWRVADVEIETADRWSAVTIPMEGTAKPRLALTVDGGRTPIADFGAVDRLGWSYGDRLWPNQLVTGALATELVVAERGEKQTTVPLPWAAAGGFAWSKGAIVLFGKGATGSGGFMLVEVATKRVTNFTPPGLQPIIAAGRVGAHIAAITTAGKVVAWP
jgi:hypothetical protein